MQTDVAVIGGGVGALRAAQKCAKSGIGKVTLCMANPFLELPFTGCDVLLNPELHPRFVCPNPEDFKIKGVDYIFDVVIDIDAQAKVIRFDTKPELSYKVVIVATGSKLPLIAPKPGDSLEQRVKEVQQVAAAIDAAQTVVVNGAGLIGVELVGDIRAKDPKKRVVLISRDGRVLGSTHPPEWQERVKKRLAKRNVEVVTGAVPKGVLGGGLEPSFTAGSVQLETGELVSYDVFLPSFAQGPNTEFLQRSGVLNERGQIKVNNCLQCTDHPEIFGVAVTTVPPNGHPVSMMVGAQAETCAQNAKLFLNGKKLVPSTQKGLARPMNVKIGSGPGGFLIWDTEMLPCPMKLLCCVPCGGFPCCPPPCCWCGPGCSTCLGNCCGPVEGEGGARLFPGFLLPKAAAPNLGFKGMGKPAQQVMAP
mmetsp:Transcript_86059/g.200103  ORF Transcript_86059/g.200103 Transcript_86059/m.200103 type:complete len:420 (+) Transcript_86059:62-1321(+)